MSNKERIEKLTESLLEQIIEENKYELVDVEFVKEGSNWYLRIYIDKDGGITIEDCEKVSREIEAKLDEKDPIPQQYILEVSSPGLDRPLKKDKDFVRNMGKLVELKLYKALNKQKEFQGTLKDYQDNVVTIELEDGTDLIINRIEIAYIRLAVIF